MSRIRIRLLAVAAAVAVAVPLLAAPSPVGVAQPPTDRLCSWWYAIGDSPTEGELNTAASRYDVVVLNAWETAAMRRLRALNPKITVLVYKDLASTRSYFGAVVGNQDAKYLPSGVGYREARWDWFARTRELRPIEWSPSYPKHWQMAVWNTSYQKRWVSNVVGEVVREGWDGVLADNDFHSLRWYSNAIIIGTRNQDDTDRELRRGLDALTSAAGEALAAAGKQFVPNVSEPHQQTGRLSAHAAHGSGVMDEHFVLRNGDGLLTFQGTTWSELRSAAAAGKRLLLMTRAMDGEADWRARTSYAAAAILHAPGVCTATSYTEDYSAPMFTRYQDARLGSPAEEASLAPTGVWTRRYSNGWVALNPTAHTVRVPSPGGLCTVDGRSTGAVQHVGPHDGAVLVACAR